MKAKDTYQISLFSAIIVAAILILASLGKWLYPTSQPYHIDKVSILVELLLTFLVLIMNRQAGIWSALLLVFSLWLGYSFFWLSKNQPCNCFGAIKGMSEGAGFGIDLFLIALAWINMVLLGAERKMVLGTIFSGFLLAIAGFWLAAYIFYG